MTTTAKSFDDRCALCELRMSEALRVVSRHRTSSGTVVYARCECGRLSMWLEPSALAERRPELRLMAGSTSTGSMLDPRRLPRGRALPGARVGVPTAAVQDPCDIRAIAIEDRHRSKTSRSIRPTGRGGP
jgi:hypothetical protein